MNKTSRQLQIIDSHTEGEPTRVVVDGAPVLSGESVAEKQADMRQNHDWIRTACLNEPRGFDAIVGAILCEPVHESSAAAVFFFNNTGYLNSCIHGTIGIAVTLRQMGRIGPGTHNIETPVGIVTIEIDDDNQVTVTNIPSYRYRKDVEIEVPGYGKVSGDIAWGGNWFFICQNNSSIQLNVSNVEELTDYAGCIRKQLEADGISGEAGAEIDHIEIVDSPADPQLADGKNFVLCPGGAYDRSPCGTGTSAKLACLAADGHLKPGQLWRQASILDTLFVGSVEKAETGFIPTIRGSAHITAVSTFLLSDSDPFCFGIGSSAISTESP